MAVFVILTPGFPTNEEDTTCLPAFQQFALSLKKLYPQHRFVVLAFQYPFEKKTYSWNGIPVISIGGSNKPGIRRFFTWINAYAELRQLHKKEKIAGMLSLWLTECSLVARHFAGFNGLKHYMWLIGQDAKTSNQYIKRIRPKGSQIVAMSDFLKEEYNRNYRQEPFLVAENGITENAFPPLNTKKRDIDILGVGSLIALKNYPLFIEIISEVRKTHPHIKVVIAGTGVDEEQLKNKVIQAGLQDTITFKGLVPHAEVFHLMNNSKIFLHTSDYEGNSTVLMEALYSGCYTFSTCPLSNRETPHLHILKTKEEFVSAIRAQLESITSENYQRVVFNTMDASAQKIMNLFFT